MDTDDTCTECERFGYPCPEHATCPYVARGMVCDMAAEQGRAWWCAECASHDGPRQPREGS